MTTFGVLNLLALFLIHQGRELVMAFSEGASSFACSNMNPTSGHNGMPEFGTAPYSVLSSRTSYTAGTEIYVTLKASSADAFKGFLVQARRADPTTNTSEMIGIFTPVQNSKTICGVLQVSNGLTHDSPQQKLSLTFKWTAPAQPDGDIVFRATFVQSFKKYWVNVRSQVIVLEEPHNTTSLISTTTTTDAVIRESTSNSTSSTSSSSPSIPSPQPPPPTTATSIATTTPAQIKLTQDTACGVSKRCFDDCDVTGCTFQVMWTDRGDTLEFELKVELFFNLDHWMAVALSTDEYMGNDSVSECVMVDGVLKTFQSYDSGYSNTRLADPHDGIDVISGSMTNNIFECRFQRRKSGGGDDKFFDIQQPMYLLFALGNAMPDFSKQHHFITYTTDKPVILDMPLITSSTSAPASKSTSTSSSTSTSTSSSTSSLPVTTSMNPQVNSFPSDPACEKTKGCYGDCGTRGCTFLVTWEIQEDDVYLSLKSVINNHDTHWMAVGFSADTYMGDDSVSECVVVDGHVKVFQSYNAGYSNMRLPDVTFGIILVSGSVTNNVFECSFLRVRSAPGNITVFDINKPWHVLFATGLAYKDYSKQLHTFATASPSRLTMANFTSYMVPEEPGQTTPTTVVQHDRFTKDNECGVTKGCFHDCDSVGCTFQITWQSEEEEEDMRFSLKSIFKSGTNIWMAVGFSADDKMGDDSISECVLVDGTVKVFQSYNKGTENSRLSDERLNIRSVSGFLKDTVFECSFLRRKAVEGNSKIFNITQQWNLMFAQGTANADFSKQQHTVIPSVSKDPVNVREMTEALTQNRTNILVKAHGCLMVFAWLFAVSIGQIVARYYKSVWFDVTILGHKVWFQIHRMCMTLAFVATFSGFILIFIDVQGYSQIGGENYKKAHPVLGIIVTILVIINPFMSIFRPDTLDTFRPVFNWAHWGVGTCAYILGVITIFFGTMLSRVNAPFYLIYILAGFVAWQVLMMLILESVLYLATKQDSVNIADNIQMNSIGYVEEHKSKKNSPGTSRIKKIMLGLHITIVSGITLAIIVILAIH